MMARWMKTATVMRTRALQWQITDRDTASLPICKTNGWEYRSKEELTCTPPPPPFKKKKKTSSQVWFLFRKKHSPNEVQSKTRNPKTGKIQQHAHFVHYTYFLTPPPSPPPFSPNQNAFAVARPIAAQFITVANRFILKLSVYCPRFSISCLPRADTLRTFNIPRS